MKKKEKCICRKHIDCKKMYIHLSWCPQGSEYKKYVKLPWWKKIFASNPLSYHDDQ